MASYKAKQFSRFLKKIELDKKYELLLTNF